MGQDLQRTCAKLWERVPTVAVLQAAEKPCQAVLVSQALPAAHLCAGGEVHGGLDLSRICSMPQGLLRGWQSQHLQRRR